VTGAVRAICDDNYEVIVGFEDLGPVLAVATAVEARRGRTGGRTGGR
jgi:hypothetical protein